MSGIVGDFRLLRKLGEGGMGEVFLAERTTAPHERVALKRVSLRAMNDAAQRRFVREATLNMMLQHENIVAVRDVGVDDGQCFMALELVDGFDLGLILAHAAAHERLPHESALYVAHELLSALAFAHAKTDAHGDPLNVVHRDVSPSNVLCSRAGEVKLADFGIAKAAVQQDTETTTGEIKGKIAYLAPEQIVGEAITQAVDVWAATIVLLELLDVRHPFRAANAYQTLQRITHAQLTPDDLRLPDSAALLRPLIEKGLAKHAKDRFATAAALRDAFVATLPDGVLANGRARFISYLDKHANELSGEQRARTQKLRVDAAETKSAQPRRSRGPLFATLAVVTLAVGVILLREEPKVTPLVIPASLPVIASAPTEPPTLPPPTPKRPPSRVTPLKQEKPAQDLTPGRLRVAVRPWADVIVNDKKVGTTPMPPLTLPPGRHRIVLKNDTLGVERAFTVDIEPGKELSLEHDMSYR